MKGESKFGLSGAPLRAINGIARTTFYLAAGAAVLCIGVIVFNFAQGGQDKAQAVKNIQTFGDPALIGAVIASLVGLWLYGEEEIYGPVLLILGAILYFSPVYLPGMAPQGVAEALDKLVAISYGPLLIGIIAVANDFGGRLWVRVRQGQKKENLRYGQGIKEETDYRNVFLGKCWQMPYCRKYVREKCPIYHAKAACWKERSGCMCEEKIMAFSMDEKFRAPANAAQARALIPRSSLLTAQQKRERCGSCIIFSHHQRQKYRALIPVIFIGGAALFFALRVPLGGFIQGGIQKAADMARQATLSGGGASADSFKLMGFTYTDLILVAFAFLAIVYAIKLTEYLLFDMHV